VFGWLDAGVENVPEMDEKLSIELDLMVNPPIVNLPFPWNTTTTTTTDVPNTTTTTTTTII
jgi:hypothetical protein